MEAKGGVIVVQKDQTATGDSGLFDVRANTVTLIGNVVVSQGRNVLRGDRLVVDMATAVSHMESDRGRVQGLFQPSGRETDNTPLMPRLR
jgi:lipopolysaccharide export system protein LptA